MIGTVVDGKAVELSVHPEVPYKNYTWVIDTEAKLARFMVGDKLAGEDWTRVLVRGTRTWNYAHTSTSPKNFVLFEDFGITELTADPLASLNLNLTVIIPNSTAVSNPYTALFYQSASQQYAVVHDITINATITVITPSLPSFAARGCYVLRGIQYAHNVTVNLDSISDIHVSTSGEGAYGKSQFEVSTFQNCQFCYDCIVNIQLMKQVGLAKTDFGLHTITACSDSTYLRNFRITGKFVNDGTHSVGWVLFGFLRTSCVTMSQVTFDVRFSGSPSSPYISGCVGVTSCTKLTHVRTNITLTSEVGWSAVNATVVGYAFQNSNYISESFCTLTYSGELFPQGFNTCLHLDNCSSAQTALLMRIQPDIDGLGPVSYQNCEALTFCEHGVTNTPSYPASVTGFRSCRRVRNCSAAGPATSQAFRKCFVLSNTVAVTKNQSLAGGFNIGDGVVSA